VVADVSTAQLRAEFNRLLQTDSAFAEAMRAKEEEQASGDGGSTESVERLVKFLRSGTTGQQEMAAVLCRGFMTLVMGRSASHGAVMSRTS